MKTSWTGWNRCLLIAVVAFLGWVLPSGAQAQTFPVTIDPQGFAGQIWVYGTGGVAGTSGVQILNLSPGAYNMVIGNAGNCGRKTFNEGEHPRSLMSSAPTSGCRILMG